MINLSFLDALELGETILPQVPQVVPKNLGQPKPAPEAKPQAPQVAPSENNVKVSETGQSAALAEVGEQDKLRAQEARFQKIGKMLAEDSSRRYALISDGDGDPENVIVTLGIQGQAIVEFAVSKVAYDPFRLLELVDRQSTRQHESATSQPK